MIIKHNSCNLEIKSIDEKGHITGYASVFNIVDDQKDMIIPGAFDGAKDVKFLWQHDAKEPIGNITSLRSDAKGLHLEAKLLLDIQRAAEAHTLLKAGAISGLSIGYSPKKSTLDRKTKVRVIEKVKLWEISLVTFPANVESQVADVKKLFDNDSKESYELLTMLDRAMNIIKN